MTPAKPEGHYRRRQATRELGGMLRKTTSAVLGMQRMAAGMGGQAEVQHYADRTRSYGRQAEQLFAGCNQTPRARKYLEAVRALVATANAQAPEKKS